MVGRMAESVGNVENPEIQYGRVASSGRNGNGDGNGNGNGYDRERERERASLPSLNHIYFKPYAQFRMMSQL